MSADSNVIVAELQRQLRRLTQENAELRAKLYRERPRAKARPDTLFSQDLALSAGVVSLIGSFLKARGANVMIYPMACSPDFESRGAYLDSGDIELRQRVEVKGRNIAFTCKADFPFQTVFVDEVHKVDRIPLIQLWGYITVNRALTHACIIHKSTKPSWTKAQVFDRKSGLSRENYECPKNLCKFVKLYD